MLSLFVDDISSCIYLPGFEFICQQERSRGSSIGCIVNPNKTQILTSCNVTSILPPLAQRNPSLVESLSTSIKIVSTSPHPTNNTLPNIPIELTTGFRLLGHPVSSLSGLCLRLLRSPYHRRQEKHHITSRPYLWLANSAASAFAMHPPKTTSPSPPPYSFIYPLNTLTHPGENGTTHSLPNIDSIIKNFLSSLLDAQDIPEYAVLISQSGMRAGGLRLLCLCTCAAPDFVIMAMGGGRWTSGGPCPCHVREERGRWGMAAVCVCVFWPPVKDELLLSMRFKSLVLTSLMSPPYPRPQLCQFVLKRCTSKLSAVVCSRRGEICWVPKEPKFHIFMRTIQ